MAGACVRGRDDEWTALMRSANAGDSIAYRRLLESVTPVLRAGARRGLARAGPDSYTHLRAHETL
ncbi:hypothetical protein DU475_19850, partial [Rhodopseudomonas sp. WA056]|nr:hypothetical protein [Rhodopseudomonas sp. WA056]